MHFFNFNFENTVKLYRADKNGLLLLKRKCNIFHNTAISSKSMTVVLAALASLLLQKISFISMVICVFFHRSFVFVFTEGIMVI